MTDGVTVCETIQRCCHLKKDVACFPLVCGKFCAPLKEGGGETGIGERRVELKEVRDAPWIREAETKGYPTGE